MLDTAVKSKKKQVKLVLIILFNSIYLKYLSFQHITNIKIIRYFTSFVLRLLNTVCVSHLQHISICTLQINQKIF